MRDRGKPLDAKDWWLEIARGKIRAAGQLVELGRQLARLVGRSTPWSHTVLSKFGNGEQPPTQELAEAISMHFDLPRPMYVPRSLAEAEAIAQVVRAIDAAVASTPTAKFADPVRSERQRTHLAQLEDLEKVAQRQAADLQSPDGSRGARRRGPRSVPRGR